MIEHNAAKDAATKEAVRIDQAIRKNRKSSMDKGWKGDLEGSKPQWQAADKLEAEKPARVRAAEDKELEAAKERTKEEKADEKKEEAAEKKEKDDIQNFEQDPKKFQKKTKQILHENDKKQASFEKQQEKLERKLENPSLTTAKKERLEDDLKELKEKRAELRHESDERQLLGIKAAGGETPENLWDVKERVGEVWGGAPLEG